SALPHTRALLLNVQRECVVTRGVEPAHSVVARLGRICLDLSQRERLVRKADPCQGAAVALRAVLERVREYGRSRSPAGFVDEPQRQRLELWGEGDIHACL